MTSKLKTLAAALCISTGAMAQMDLGSQTNTLTKQAESTPAAQSLPSTTAVTTPSAGGGIGSLIGQFTNNLSTGALTDEFAKNKGEFVKSANNTNSGSGVSNLLQKVEGGIKPTAFSSGWAAEKSNWLASAKKAVTVKEGAALLSKLEANINPKYFTGEWAKLRPMWQAGLKKLAN
jgi:hypothetical protein